MKKNDLLISEKIKGIMTISSINIPHKIKVQLEFTEHYLIIKFLDLKNKIKQAVEKIFFPLYKKSSNIYFLNYTLLKMISPVDLSRLKISMINPKSNFTFTLTIKNLEIIGMLFNKKLSFEGLNLINRKLINLINLEIKHLIGQFLYLFTLLRDCLDPKKCENPTIEDILFKSYITGKNYYEKYIFELKKNTKIKKEMKKLVLEKIDKLNKMKRYNLNNYGKSTESEEEDNYENAIRIENLNDLNNEESNNNLEKNYDFSSFDSLINEFKYRTSVNIEESIILFFKIVSIDRSQINMRFQDTKSISINLKNLNEKEKRIKGNMPSLVINKYIPSPGNISANIPRNKTMNLFDNKNYNIDIKKININYINENFSESTKNTSDKKTLLDDINQNNKNNGSDLLETPKFCFKKNQSANNSLNDNLSMNEVYKLIEECSKNHTFLQPYETFNIFFNTTEIIHRKFFEIFFDEFIGKIFYYEKDKDNLIKLDSLYNIFLYLRGLKNILFVEKNRIYFSNVFFMDDDDE